MWAMAWSVSPPAANPAVLVRGVDRQHGDLAVRLIRRDVDRHEPQHRPVPGPGDGGGVGAQCSSDVGHLIATPVVAEQVAEDPRADCLEHRIEHLLPSPQCEFDDRFLVATPKVRKRNTLCPGHSVWREDQGPVATPIRLGKVAAWLHCRPSTRCLWRMHALRQSVPVVGS
jgi:hypothetical protein